MDDRLENDDIQAMIDDCEKRESKLSAWDESFIAGVTDWFYSNGFITPDQEKTLIKIWDKVTKNG